MGTLIPHRVKYRKSQRGSRKGTASRCHELSFGDFGLKCLGRGWIKGGQIEACRVAATRHLNSRGKLWIRVFPHKPVSKKPIEVRQGKGKGNAEFWVVVVKPGTILFEIGGVSEKLAYEALRLAAAKLGVPTRCLSR